MPYNPNYQDIAVLEAVLHGWEELAGFPHINDVKAEVKSEGDGPIT